ncbi:homoserine O-succinyltransferase [Gammaproteobacteria bacterium]|nr:homoserine O-succinyltransferase [Gammaproteobacteria bacterium]
MPIVAHSALPTFIKMMNEGENVLSQERAEQQDIRELHIGLLNMMPDAALEATERQFFRLIGACNRIAQFYVHPFSFPEIPRSQSAQDYIDKYYEKFEDLQKLGLDALIISGANPQSDDLSNEPFWIPLQKTLDWAKDNVTSTLCACLATHATVQHFHDIKRQKLESKRWGVFSHRVQDQTHPLVRHINTRFDVPHSRWNDLSSENLHAVGIKVLVKSKVAGVHLAVSEDGFRFVYFQGHPEYEINSLLKEYKREVQRFIKKEIKLYPPFPTHYFGQKAKDLLESYEALVVSYLNENKDIDIDINSDKAQILFKSLFNKFPEEQVLAHIDNTWNDTGKILINNWLGLVYQLTNSQRDLPFMDGIDKNNPLDGF